MASRMLARKIWATSVSIPLTFAAATPAAAQEAQTDEHRDEIIVTAQRRDQSLQQVPISITVLRGDQLDQSSAVSVNDALDRVPGVAVINELGLSRVTVRGVTAALARSSGASPIGYYLDSVPFGFVRTALAPDANSYDLDRVEVLRGPQGTLYGVSALNGVMRVLTRGPDTDSLEFKGRASVSTTEHGDESYRGDIALNIPIVTDVLAARAVASYQRIGGWIDKPGDPDANEGTIRDIRLRVRATPTPQLTIDGMAWYSRSHFDAWNTSRADYTNPNLFAEPVRTRYDIYSLRFAYDFPTVTLTSATSNIRFANDIDQDFSFVAPSTVLFGNLRTRATTQEVTLTSRDWHHVRWTLGAFYRDARDNNQFFRRQYVEPIGIVDRSKSVALFGELTYLALGGKLELTGGLRYFHDNVSQDELGNTTGTRPLLTTDTDFEKVTPRAVITWLPTHDLTFYASYGQGFRSGLVQNPVITRAAPAFSPARPDTLINYEVGSRGRILGGIVNYDLSLYYLDWQDIQQTLTVTVTPPGGSFAGFVNANSASGLGVDFQLGIRPARGLSLGGSLSWSGLELDSNVISGGRVIIPRGARPNGTSRWTLGGNLDYEFPLGGNLRGQFSLAANYRSRQVFTTVNVGGATLQQASDGITDVRGSFAIETGQHWRLMLFVNNLLKEDGISSVQSGGAPGLFIYPRPRTIGLQIEFHS